MSELRDPETLVIDKEKWMILEGNTGTSFGGTEGQLIAALSERIGASTPFVFRWQPNGKPVSGEEFKAVMEQHNPGVIAWVGQYPWMHYHKELSSLRDILKVNLWFDDPIMRINSSGILENVKATSNDPSFSHFIWDTYWIEKFEKLTGADAFHLNLACSEREFYPSEHRLSEDAAFVGCLHSPKFINEKIGQLPESFKIFMKYFRWLLDDQYKDKFIDSWDKMMDHTINCLPEGFRRLFLDQVKTYPGRLNDLYYMIWAISKNEGRVKMLKKSLNVTGVTMITECLQRDHAQVSEIREMVGEFDQSKFKIWDGGMVTKHGSIGQFSHYGKIQLQTIDPQSVYTGIPYRNFQCAASKRPLITHILPEWHKHWDVKKDMIVYGSWGEYEDVLNKSMSDDMLLDSVAENSYKRFKLDHTWFNRLGFMMPILEGKTSKLDMHRKAEFYKKQFESKPTQKMKDDWDEKNKGKNKLTAEGYLSQKINELGKLNVDNRRGKHQDGIESSGINHVK